MSAEIKQRPIQQIEVKKLKLNPKNPRKNDEAVDTVAKSIEKFGFNVPLFCDTSLTVYCGNTRLKAARKLNRKCYTAELDPRYCDVIIKRWENLTGNNALKL